jgi:hypothetical protein
MTAIVVLYVTRQYSSFRVARGDGGRFCSALEVTPQIAGHKLPPTQGQGFKFHKLQLQTIRN